MKYNPKLDKFLNSSTLSASIFLLSGGYKTYRDYKDATPKYKNRFLIKDTVVLLGAAAGLSAHSLAGRKISKNHLYEQTITKISNKINNAKYNQSFKYTKAIVKELASGFSSTAAGILGALSADYILSKTKFKQPKLTNNSPQEKNKYIVYVDNNLNKISDENTRNVVYSSIADMPVMKFISPGMIGAQAIELAKEREFETRFKNTTKYLVNDTLVPLFLLSVSSALTKNLKPGIRIPVIFSSLVGGTLLFKKLLEQSSERQKIIILNIKSPLS